MKNPLSSMLLAAVGACGVAQGAAAQDVKVSDAHTAMCIGCHGIPGYQASFPEVHKVPMIAGQSAKYIVSALTAYQKGERKHPTMRSIAASLSEKDMAALAAFYEQQGRADGAPAAMPKAEPTGQVAELVKKGNCISCHGDNFSKPIDPSYPKLAGQHADYLYVALKEYQTQNNPQVGRSNPVMMGMVLNFNHKELKALSQYIASLPGELKTVPQSRFR
jgi:cytochrome c553